MEQQSGGKRPIALPITLILLMVSLMGNVLLYTKNIGHSRGDLVRDGEAVLQGFQDSRDAVAYWTGLSERITDAAEGSPDKARSTAELAADFIERGPKGLDVLMEIATQLDPTTFDGASESFLAFENKLLSIVKDIGGGSGALTKEEQGNLADMQFSLASLTELLSAFYYGVEDDQIALIRLAGGHNWLDIAAQLRQAFDNYVLVPEPA